MRKKALQLLFILSIALLFDCHGRDRSITANLGAYGIEGRIVAGEGITSVAALDVRVVGTGIATQTDEEGRFTLTGLPRGESELVITRPGDRLRATVEVSLPLAGRFELELSAAGAFRRRAGAVRSTMSGTITSIALPAIRIAVDGRGEVPVTVGEKVELEGDGAGGIETLDLGDRIRVTGPPTAAGGLRAEKVRIEARAAANADDRVFVSGIIALHSDNQLTIETWNGLLLTVLLGDGTAVVRSGNPAGRAHLTAGAPLLVAGIARDMTTVQASRIEIGTARTGPRGEVSVDGTIASVAPDQLIVQTALTGDVVVILDGKSVIEVEGKRISAERLQPGTRARITGLPVDASSIRATSIEAAGRRRT